MYTSPILAALAFPLLSLAAPTSPHTPKRLPNIALLPRQANGSCDLSGLQQPPSTMAPPTPDLALVLIAQGRGTQNYTCTSSTSAPAAIGAVATLFNASCAVAEGTLGTLQEDPASIGAHFFVDNTTPEFDIIGLGSIQAKKAENCTAPQANAVPWLRLEAKAQSKSAVRQIYRLNTVGGVAPASCEGRADGETVAVEYQAQYWVYACTATMEALRGKKGL